MKLIIQNGIVTHYFKSVKEIRTLAEHLIGQAECIERDGIEPPYLYSQYETEAPTAKKVTEAHIAIKNSLL